MAMKGKMSVIKYLMFIFNFLFWLSGFALIVIGGIIRDKYGFYLTFADSKYAAAAVFLIVVGVIVSVIGFLGCCGAIKENNCMITTFAVLLTIVLILEITAGALGFTYRKKVTGVVKKTLHHGMRNYNTEKGAKRFFDWLQKKLKCCGYNSPNDWKNKNISAPAASSGGGAQAGNGTFNVPVSCKSEGGNVYQDGCKDQFQHFVQKNLIVIGGTGIGLGFLQVIGIIFACCLMGKIRDQYEVI